MLNVEGDRLPQARDLRAQILHGAPQHRLQQRVVQVLLPVAQPAIARHGALHVEAAGLRRVRHRTEAHLQHEQRVLDQEGAQVRAVLLVFTEFDEQGFDIRARWMRERAGPRARGGTLGDDGPIQAREEGPVALHDGVVVAQGGQDILATWDGQGYHSSRLLGRDRVWYL